MELPFGKGWLRSAVMLIGAVFAGVGAYGLLTLTAPVLFVHLATTTMPLFAGGLMIVGAWRWPRVLIAAAVCLDIEAVLAGAVGTNGAALSMVLPLIGVGLVQPIAGPRTNFAVYVGGGFAALAGYLAALLYGPAASLPKVAPIPALLLIVGGAIALAIALNWQAAAQLKTAIVESGRELLVRRALDDELRSANDRLEAVLSAAPLGIASVDQDGIIRFWNAAAEGIFAWPADQVIGSGLGGIAGIGAPEMAGLLASTRAGEVVSGPRVAGRSRTDRHLELRLFLAPLRDAAGGVSGATVIIEDVSERLVLEEQLRQAQKMETLGQLAGSIAHDFNNVLAAITGFAELAASSLDAEAPALKDLREISRAADRAANLTKSLLVFGRRTSPNASVIEINPIVRTMLPMLGQLTGPTITIETRLDPEAGEVRIDPGQLEQAVVNLVVNARDSMAHGGVITIETGRVPMRDGASPGVGAVVRLAVGDSGTGMTRDVAARIFEPFYTTKAVGEGTGLGLAIVHGIVKDAGGDVSVESAPGKGTTIGISLPGVASGTAVAAEPPETQVRGSETVLLVEDEDAIRMLAGRVLSEHGYRVVAARDAAEAREIWSDHGATIDVVVSDVTLPGTSGLDLAGELLRARPELRVLFMSGFVPSGLDRPGLPENAGFLPKPFTINALLGAVRDVIDGAPPVASEVGPAA